MNRTLYLPDQDSVEKWKSTPVIERLMFDHKWNMSLAELWFSDFMKWLYTSQKWHFQNGTNFAMDTLHYLDDVWHTYILHTKEYMNMCQDLFSISYIHHTPAPPFKRDPIDKDIYRKQLTMLLDDWGDEYVTRVWGHAADVSDILHGEYLPLKS